MKFVIPPDIDKVEPICEEEKQAKMRSKGGLTFKFITSEIRLVKHILEQNGFVDVEEAKSSQPPLIQWSSCMIKSHVY